MPTVGSDAPRRECLDAPAALARAMVAILARLGFEHILSGLDHLSFVFGLMLLVSLRRLFWVVTAFTLGHSITLVLSALDVVRVQQRPVEILSR
jgi:hypothetical protein